ncbi:NACHT domain-containing protein [Burkholderia sp. MSMB1835]|uniref:NACHT domain-containing protein n=1 Tax=Burkholderia sp. MSMB1835 TaxID=1637876 RepID=UPI000A7B4188|nr:NACHT domain-containing protein [Burkholderia sp. MSMB1835]
MALKESDRRKENLKAVFGTPNVFFIDDFGRQFLYKEQIQGFVPYNLPVYIESLTESSQADNSGSALLQLKSWYGSISEPLVVIKGHGGIGKTTLVKQFLDEIHSDSPETGILFIDSHEIIGELESIIRSRQKIDDIYDFYHAQSISQAGDTERLSKDLLSLSVDNGSLVIVLDGLDEVIAKLGAKFDAVSFIRSISTIYSTDLQRAKIIITCRDYFWDSLLDVGPVKKIDLQPFNRSMADEFFRKSLDTEAKVSRALSIAGKFALKSPSLTEEVYIPYVLDLIVYLIRQKNEFSDAPLGDADIGTLLNPDIPNDFLVANVCLREISKLHSLRVESQIEFFVQLSVAKDGHVSIYDVKALLGRLPHQTEEVVDDTVERLKGHPLLIHANNKLYFRYDFFNEYFKSLYIVKYFSARDFGALSSDFVEVAADYLRFDGDFMHTVCSHLTFDDELMLFSIETIERLRNDLPSLDPRSRYRNLRACSAVFSLVLSLRREGKVKFDAEMCSGLMRDFFEKDGEIQGLSLVNVGSNSAVKPIFDFRGQVFRDCYFERYDFFWECAINSETRFLGSTFKSLEPRKGVRPQFYEGTFGEGSDTVGISHLLAREKEVSSHQADKVRNDIIRFFRLFYVKGNFYPQKQEFIRGKLFTGTYLPVLLKNRVIEEFVDPLKATLKQYRVSSEYMPILKHIEQGAPSIELNRVVKLFSA